MKQAQTLLNTWLWMNGNELAVEKRQLEDEGRDLSAVATSYKSLTALGDRKLQTPENQRTAFNLLDKSQTLPVRRAYAFREPSDLAGIRRLRSRGLRAPAGDIPAETLRDRVLGAWLGRCAGCQLGKPVEGAKHADLKAYLQDTGQWPLRQYIKFSQSEEILKKHPWARGRDWYDRLDHFAIDDDTNYTVTGLLVVEKHGPGFRPVDVAQFWIENIPAMSTCTAERVAYRNFLENVAPPQSAWRRNPYREWIGAQIRADAFGYAAAGDPARAAELAWRDACISHVKNGIYGEMWVAAMIAAAPLGGDARSIVRAGLGQIPRTSRLYASIAEVLRWHEDGVSYDDAVARIHKQWNERFTHDWCHTISNAMVVAVGLLWGGMDYGRSICMAVQACFDTDCNGATVGSIVGMALGVSGIPVSWTVHARNTLHTSLAGNNVVTLDSMTERTIRVRERIKDGRKGGR